MACGRRVATEDPLEQQPVVEAWPAEVEQDHETLWVRSHADQGFPHGQCFVDRRARILQHVAEGSADAFICIHEEDVWHALWYAVWGTPRGVIVRVVGQALWRVVSWGHDGPPSCERVTKTAMHTRFS